MSTEHVLKRSVLSLFMLISFSGLALSVGCGPVDDPQEEQQQEQEEQQEEEQQEPEDEINEQDEEQEEEQEEEVEEEEEEEEINNAPIAVAGPDQSVEGGESVQLDGTASGDEDGDEISFSWEQLAGTAVTLSDSSDPMPTFTAPDEDASLLFQLTVSDGELTATDTVSIQVEGLVVPTLYVANLGAQGVLSFENPASLNGNVPPSANLQGAQTQLFDPIDLFVSASGKLLVANLGADSITSYNDATNINGNIEADGIVQGAATLLVDPVGLAMNSSQDLLFVADAANDVIFVFESASASSFNGNIAPIRIIETATTADINQPLGIALSEEDELYVANNNGNNVLVFANASNLNGDVAPSRIIDSAAFADVYDVYLDSEENLLVVDHTNNEIYTFNDASTLNGAETPDFTLTVNGAANLSSIAVDSAGRGYISDESANAIWSYDDVASLNGAFTPDRTIQGANTQLNFPWGIHLVE